MRTFLCGLLVVFVSCSGWALTLGENTSNGVSKVFVPMPAVDSAPAFVRTNAVVNGQYMKAPNGQIFMCLTPGTTATNSYPSGYGRVVSGSAVLVSVPKAIEGWSVCNCDGGGLAYVSVGSAAVFGYGYRLAPGACLVVDSPLTAPVSVIGTSDVPISVATW